MAIWILDLAVVIVLLAASEVAFRYGKRVRARCDEEVRTQVMTAQASTLGLLALLLAFTLSMADSRFDSRRVLLVKEANAVGTTYLRAHYLPEPVATQSRALLRNYVKVRRDYYRASAADAPASTERSQELQHELWVRASSLAARYLDSDLIGRYVESLNEMIDAEAARDAAVLARVPSTIKSLLLFVALISAAVSGYATGLGGRRVNITLTLLPILIAVACAIILDLDRTRAGLITTGDLPMMRVERAMDAEVTAGASAATP